MRSVGEDGNRCSNPCISTVNVASRVVAGLAIVAAGAALMTAQVAVPTAAAEACPDVEVVFARGTFEPQGVGVTGQAFVDALQARLGAKTVQVYAVDYPASLDFARAADGVGDASNEILDVTARCPGTKIVLGGYSQGAAVAAYTTADTVPPGVALPEGVTGPMPTATAKHVAAVALFGKPHAGFLSFLNRDAPPITIGELYTAKIFESCVPEDPIYSPTGNDQSAHGTYPVNGMADQAADFAVHAVSQRI